MAPSSAKHVPQVPPSNKAEASDVQNTLPCKKIMQARRLLHENNREEAIQLAIEAVNIVKSLQRVPPVGEDATWLGWAHYSLGDIYRCSQREKEAIEQFNAAILAYANGSDKLNALLTCYVYSLVTLCALWEKTMNGKEEQQMQESLSNAVEAMSEQCSQFDGNGHIPIRLYFCASWLCFHAATALMNIRKHPEITPKTKNFIDQQLEEVVAQGCKVCKKLDLSKYCGQVSLSQENTNLFFQLRERADQTFSQLLNDNTTLGLKMSRNQCEVLLEFYSNAEKLALFCTETKESLKTSQMATNLQTRLRKIELALLSHAEKPSKQITLSTSSGDGLPTEEDHLVSTSLPISSRGEDTPPIFPGEEQYLAWLDNPDPNVPPPKLFNKSSPKNSLWD